MTPRPDSRAGATRGAGARGPASTGRRGGAHPRGGARHALGRVAGRARPGAGRRAAGALLDRAGPVRPGGARGPRRRVRAGADRGRRVVPPLRARLAGAGHSLRPHPRHPDRRRHHQRLRHGLRRACALHVHRPRDGLRPAGRHRRRHHARGRPARASAGRARARWRVRGSSYGHLAAAEPVARRVVPRDGRGVGLRAGAATALAMARLCRGCGGDGLGLGAARPGQQRRRRPVGAGAHCPCRRAARAGRRFHRRRAASHHRRCRR